MTANATPTHAPARGQLRYEGKAKRVYETAEPTLAVVEYKDDATAFNGEKRASIAGKGQLNNEISALFMGLLASHDVPTHFLAKLGAREQLVQRVDIVPLEVVVRNVVAGSLAARTGLAEGTPLPWPIVEFYYKRDDLGDPLLTRAHVRILGLADNATIDRLQQLALDVNDVLVAHLARRDVTLVDAKFEFGRNAQGELVLADEISPDTCRFWDSNTGEKLDKDRFRRDMGGVEEAYAEMLRRLAGEGSA